MVSGRGFLGGLVAVGLVALAPAEASGAPPALLPASTAPPSPGMPRLHHAPVANAKEGERIELRVTVEYPELLRYMGAIYRTSKGEVRAVPFLRSAGGAYV